MKHLWHSRIDKFLLILMLGLVFSGVAFGQNEDEEVAPIDSAKILSETPAATQDSTPEIIQEKRDSLVADTTKGKHQPLDENATSKEVVSDSLVQTDSISADSTSPITKDTLAAKTSIFNDSNFIYNYITHPVLNIVTLPIELVIVPTLKLALFPIKQPIQYMLKNKVLDKTINLMSFGEKKPNIILPHCSDNHRHGFPNRHGLYSQVQSLRYAPSAQHQISVFCKR